VLSHPAECEVSFTLGAQREVNFTLGVVRGAVRAAAMAQPVMTGNRAQPRTLAVCARSALA
jgi:hypothetical protein